jgi:uncharacterized protein
MQMAPITEAERLKHLDVIRGFALLGILLMNIVSMGGLWRAYDNPLMFGHAGNLNTGIWIFLHIFMEGKMRALFSIMYGAAIIFLTSRLEQQSTESADIYFRRTLWLFIFGIAHAYLLFDGDILFTYAICGLFLYPFRKLNPKILFVIAALIIGMNAYVSYQRAVETRSIISLGKAAMEASSNNQELTEEQEENLSDYNDWSKYSTPTLRQMEKEARPWRGSTVEVLKARAEEVFDNHSDPIYSFGNTKYDVWCMMLVGMALLRLGILTGEKRRGFYLKFLLFGYGVGVFINSFTAWQIVQSQFDPFTIDLMSTTYDVGRLLVAFGHIALLMLIVKSGIMHWFTRQLALIGQTALSNYIFQSLIGSIIFTGYGFGLYGRLDYYQLYIIVIAIWSVQLIITPIWLRSFKYGPLEWLLRSLTYWNRQPMLR